jgi:hypothetical protein
MTHAITPNDEGSCYEISLAGHLDDHWSAWFGGFAITHEDDGTTTLRGRVADQAVLHGLLAKVRDLGATLISLTTFETVSSPVTPPLSACCKEAVTSDAGVGVAVETDRPGHTRDDRAGHRCSGSPQTDRPTPAGRCT